MRAWMDEGGRHTHIRGRRAGGAFLPVVRGRVKNVSGAWRDQWSRAFGRPCLSVECASSLAIDSLERHRERERERERAGAVCRQGGTRAGGVVRVVYGLSTSLSTPTHRANHKCVGKAGQSLTWLPIVQRATGSEASKHLGHQKAVTVVRRAKKRKSERERSDSWAVRSGTPECCTRQCHTTERRADGQSSCLFATAAITDEASYLSLPACRAACQPRRR